MDINTQNHLPRRFTGVGGEIGVGRRNCGFTYMALLIVLAIMGIASAAALQFGIATYRRAAEESLLNIGGEFSQALASYRRLTPVGQSGEPRDLQDLLKDPRFPGVVRHLRKLYYDPITGRQEWGVQRSEDSQRIIGIFSLSDAQPIKSGNFEPNFQVFSGKNSYQEWIFTGAQADDGVSAQQTTGSVNPRELFQQEANPPAMSPALPEGEVNPRALLP